MTRPKVFLPELDGLRFVAFLLIFIHHSSTQGIIFFREIRNIGWLGVEIFFCLSAFLLTRLLLREVTQFGNVDVYKFFVRRILRIWPLYVGYVLFAVLLSSWLQLMTSHHWYRALGLLTFTDDFFAAFEGFNPIRYTGHLWTISYEEQFYLCLPFLIPWLVRQPPARRVWFLIATLVVSQLAKCISIYYQLSDLFLWTMPVTHLESIVAGIVMAFYEETCTRLNRTLVGSLMVLSACLIFFLPDTTVTAYHLIPVYLSAGLFSASVVCFAINARTQVLRNFLSNAVISFLGKISFGLYVFHSICLHAADRVLGVSHPLLNFIVALTAVVLISSISYVLFERKFLLIKKTRFTRIPVLQ